MSKAIKIDRRELKMKLLVDFATYKRWSGSRYGWAWVGRYARREERRNQEDTIERCRPLEFPCMAQVMMTDHRMEESEPFYLYRSDLEAMLTWLKSNAAINAALEAKR
jgi:hypothetical protein